MGPLMDLDREVMDMQLMDESINRYYIAKYFLNITGGTHFNTKKRQKQKGFKFIYDNITSFRLQPYGDRIGIFVIDGQRY